jgi:hypothetical protein
VTSTAPVGEDGPVPDPSGFAYDVRRGGDVVITHHGKRATVLRGPRAEEFLADVHRGDDQQVMARWTGSYKRGNERAARRHERNRGRA